MIGKLADPALVDLSNGNGIQRIHAASPFLASNDESGISQDLKMLHDAEAGEFRKSLDDFRRHLGTVSQAIEDGSASFIREGFPDQVQII